MTKTVLCYGDSLTWGYDADTIGRHAYKDRWPSALQASLGNDVRIIAEGHQSWAVELLLGEQRHKLSGGRRQQDPPRRQHANLFGCMSFGQTLLNEPDELIVKIFVRNEAVVG